MSEFENIIEPKEEIKPEENPIIEESTDDTSAETMPCEETKNVNLPQLLLGLGKRFFKPICALVALVVLILILKAVFTPAKDKSNTLFVDNMLVFNEINVENHAIMYGVIDKKANLVTDADFSLAYLLGDGMIAAQVPPAGGDAYVYNPASYGLIDQKGEEITKFSFSNCGVEFSEGVVALAEGDLWGYADKKGNWVIKPRFALAHSFHNSLAGVKDSKSRKWGFVDKKGKWVIKAQFEDVGSFEDGIAPAKLNGKWGFIDKDGNWKIKNEFIDVADFENSVARAQDISGNWGYIDEDGKWVIKPRFQELGDFSEGLAAAKKNGKWGFIDKKGNWKIENEFYDVGSFADGLAYAKSEPNGKYGYINKKAKWKIEPKYDVAYDFADALACVKTKDAYGYIGKSGKTKIDFSFKYALSFYDDGYAPVCTGKKNTSDDDKWFVIDRKGKAIFKETFDGIMR